MRLMKYCTKEQTLLDSISELLQQQQFVVMTECYRCYVSRFDV